MTRALVIGGTANELVAAHLLARAGHTVTVLDPLPARRPAEDGWLPARIAAALGLDRGRVRSERPDPWIAVPLASGGRLELWHDLSRSVAAIARLSAHDAGRWPAFCARMARLAGLLEAVYSSPPPDPVSRDRRDIGRLLGLALRARWMGREGLEDLLRLLPMPVADLLDDWFESEALKGALGALAVSHLQQGPRSGGTAFALLHRHVGCPAGVFRPARSNVPELLSAGIEIRRAQTARIELRGGKVAGVALSGGEELPASLVLSGLDPTRTLLELADPGSLDPELARGLRHIRRRGVVAMVELVLERDCGFPTLGIAPSLDYVERAYDDAKYRGVSASPCIDAVASGVDGRHSLRVQVQYAPYDLAGGWEGAARERLADAVVAALSEHEPGLPSLVRERSVLAPVDLERIEGWPEGQMHQAELALDQALWMRPLPELAHYRTPIGGLYLCGAAMHPGGGILGACGAHAAHTAIGDLGRSGP